MKGNILGREKTSYADIIKIDDLESVVRGLTEREHKAILKKLISGAFDGPFRVTLPTVMKEPLSKEEGTRRSAITSSPTRG